MRISDWSSDVCSSDLREGPARALKSPPRFSYHRGRKQNPPHKRWAPEAISYAWVPESKVRQRRNRKKGVGRFQPACLVRRPPVWTSFLFNVTRDRKSTRLNSSH